MRNLRTRPAAMADIRGDSEHSLLRGTVRLYQMCGGVLLEVDVTGLPQEDAFFGFHIHQGATCTGPGFADAGPHFNPTNALHPNHAGDLPPLLGGNGRAYMSVLTDRFSISDVVGRTVIIHSQPDDFRTQPSGDSGARIGCGVIRLVK